jgi:dTDP-4-dehydrorhamnose reductase
MKILLTGAAGQLGQALRQQVPVGVELIATSRSGDGGAYTAVDKAESEPELALAENGGVPRAFAEALLETGGRLLQVSTDFVFNGQQGSPYRPEQARNPLGAYGATKAAGEEAVEQMLGARPCASYWRPCDALNPDTTQPAQGC